jgi:hypothetical protein
VSVTKYKSFRSVGFRAIAITVFLLPFTTAISADADDILVLPAAKSVLSVYSYGRGPKITPELTDWATHAGVSISAAPSIGDTKSARPVSIPTPPSTAIVATGTAISTMDPAPSSPVPEGDLSLPRFVTLTWDPSPDDAIAGYQIYIGVASQQYKPNVRSAIRPGFEFLSINRSCTSR